MRGSVVAVFVALGVASYACDSFEEPDAQPSPDAGVDVAAANDAQGGSDAANDQAAACEGEPDWVTTASADPMRVCNGVPTNVLDTSAHCGRCDHSCGAEQCAGGMCAEQKVDTATVILDGVRDGALYYSRRPGGTFSTVGQELKRFVPGSAPLVLTSLEVDGGGTEKKILATSPGTDHVYLRTNTSLRRVSTTVPTTGLPEFVAPLSTTENVSSVTVADDRVYVTTPSQNRVDQIFFDGGIVPFITGPEYLGETRLVGTRYFYLSQRFLYFLAGTASSVHMREGTVDKTLYESQDKVGSVAAIDGNEMYVMRAGPAGAIVRIDLATGATQPFYEGDLDNTIYSISVTLDATHVYWLKETAGSDATTEIWKRARCGGAAVRIGKHPKTFRLLTLGDRLYIGADDGLFSIAK
jgi:hypothetical protein